MRSRKIQSGQVDYLLLLLVVIIGVAAGNLLSNWITARVAAHQLEQSIAEFSDQVAAEQAASRQRQEQLRTQTRSERANSRTGQFLKKSCDEWTATNERYENYTSRQEMRKACDRYEDFLETGITPNQGFR